MYHMPGPLGTFIDGSILLITELPMQRVILIFADFNLDHMVPENVGKVDHFIQNLICLRVHKI